MADPIEPNSADDKAAKIAEIQAKMAEAKARREAAAAAPPVPAPAAGAAAAGAPADDKEAKLAELKAKMAAAKAKTAAGTASGAASPAAATASAATATATVAEPSPSDARIAAMRAKVSETRVTASPRPASKPAPSKNDSDVGVWFFGRRSFLQSVGWMSFFGFLTIVILGAVRAMFPRVIYERPPIFKAGFPGDYVPGTVSEKYKDEERVWIIRQTDGSFIALLAICTHLGCTPRWLTSENKFKCPCHGSGFRGNPNWGVNFEGPAPRPLERIAIHLAPDGQIEIDKSKKFLWEKQQWDDPAATLKG
ncbi:MAG: petC [Chlorobi bacterium]|jgi:cytochrome b6-f complex iron-sulfur subunit|nr:petC [Chlorobiota bacterium]